MPDLSKLPVPQYGPDQPYHWEYDNLPLKALSDRDDVINGEVDAHANILRDCAGTQGTLAARLSQSIEPDGGLLPAAVDESNHNIAEHVDGTIVVSDQELADYVLLGFPDLVNPVQFVRMLDEERDKLQGIAKDATNFSLSVETPSNIVLFEEGPVHLVNSESVHWQLDAPNTVRAVLAISTAFAHRHYYSLTPVMVLTADTIPVRNKLYKVTTVATPYIAGSLRVYLNGIRLVNTAEVFFPNAVATGWNLNGYTEDAAYGKFTLDKKIADADVISVDFDILLG